MFFNPFDMLQAFLFYRVAHQTRDMLSGDDQWEDEDDFFEQDETTFEDDC